MMLFQHRLRVPGIDMRDAAIHEQEHHAFGARLKMQLAGQHADYLARALDEYQKGARKNAIMANFAAHLTSAQVEEIADFFSKEQPSLQTLPRPATRISEE